MRNCCEKERKDAAKVCSTKDNRRRASQCNTKASLPLFEIALVLVRLDHIASAIVNANHGIIALEIEPAED